MANKKILIFRFSALGDVLQSLSIVGRIHADWPDAEIHFCTRAEFVDLIRSHPGVVRVWSLNKRSGFRGLWQLGWELRKISWTHVYDAHNNLRTRLLGLMLNGFFGERRIFRQHSFLRRSIYRMRRFFLFTFRVNLFPQPFSGQGALLEPLLKWGLRTELPPVPQLYFFRKLRLDLGLPKKFIAMAPSAAHQLKRWPLEHFQELVRLLKSEQIVLLGGPEDSFLETIRRIAPDRVLNFAGVLSLEESAMVVEQASALVSNDTGLMHVAEQLGIPCVALMGPAPFGFPSRPSTYILERQLQCRPCSKHGQGPCVNQETYQKCLIDIQPAEVQAVLQKLGVVP